MKIYYCTTCGQPKVRTNCKKKRTICKPCLANRSRLYRKNNFEKLKKEKQEYRLKNIKRYQDRALVKAYGITLDQYNQMLNAQNSVCAVCLYKETSKRNTRLCVDHDHKTGKIRGLLCNRCNRSLGLLQDSPNVIKSLLEYILKHST